jgi:hypothetical protein
MIQPIAACEHQPADAVLILPGTFARLILVESPRRY